MSSTKEAKEVESKEISDVVITPLSNEESTTIVYTANGIDAECFDDDLHSEESVTITNSCFINRWSNFIQRIKKPLLSLIKAVARYSAKNPGLVMTITATLSIFFLVIGFFTGFRIVTNNIDSFTPFGSISEQTQEWLEKESGFPQTATWLNYYVHSEGENVISVDGVSRVFEVLEALRDSVEYQKVCESGEGKHCKVESVTGFWSHTFTTFFSQVSTDEEAIMAMQSLTYSNGAPCNRNAIFGNVKESSDTESRLDSAEAYSSFLHYAPVNKDEFEDKAQDILNNIRKKWKDEDDNPWRLEFNINNTSIEKEMYRGINADMFYIMIAFVMMFTLASLYFFRRHRVQSQSIIGIGAVLSVTLSLFFSFGIFFCMGVPFTGMTMMLPFVLAGIGLDDAFIITGAFSRTDPNMDIINRVDETMDEIGISVFISTLTTFITFTLSAFSTIPAIRWFCYYAATTIMVDFIFQITFFVAFIVYNERRKKANRYDIFCCFKHRLSIISSEPGELLEEKSSVKERLMAFYVDILLRPVTMCLVLLIFSTIFIFGLLSAVKMKQDWDFTMLVPRDSFVLDYFVAQDTYLNENIGVFGSRVYFRDIDVSLKTNRDKMSQRIDTLVDDSYYVTRRPFYFWIDDFEKFISSNKTPFYINDLEFNDQLAIFLNNEPFKSIYGDDIVRNETGHVTASNVHFIYSNFDRTQVVKQIKALSEQRRLSRESPLNIGKDAHEYSTFTYGDFYFSWEFSSIVVSELVKTSIFALLSVFIISLIFIPHPSGCVFVTATVAMMFVELIGLFQATGIYIHSVTTLTLVMAIGLSVDFIIHIVYSYFETNAKTRKGKVYVAMMTMGSSLLVGGGSTFFGTVFMSLGSSEVSWIFFMTFVGIVALGLTHSLILLPVVLSLFGPLFNPEDPNFHITSYIKSLNKEDHT